MTSGNLSVEPIAFEDCDAAAGRTALVRRARGYAPAPIALVERFPEPVLACGARLGAVADAWCTTG